MKYMAMIFIDEACLPADADLKTSLTGEYARFAREAKKAGVFAGGEALQPGMTATVVRMLESGPSVTDGPYSGQESVLGGYFMLECENLDQAIEWAAKIPDARRGAIEVRPVIETGPERT